MTIDVISDDPEVQAHYEACLAAGSSPRLAEMLAMQQPPGCDTDTRYMARSKVGGDQFERSPWLGKYYKETSERLAPGSTSGARYCADVARFAGDPRAWVRSRSDIRRAVADRPGYECEGDVTVKALYAPEKKQVPIAESIVKKLVARKLAMEPGLAETAKGRKQARREVLERHTPPNRKHLIKE